MVRTSALGGSVLQTWDSLANANPHFEISQSPVFHAAQVDPSSLLRSAAYEVSRKEYATIIRCSHPISAIAFIFSSLSSPLKRSWLGTARR